MTKGVVVRPILTKEFACRGQVDLIDMQAMAHSNYKWIMVYQDHLTKFCVIRPLTTKRASEVAFQLMDIFLLMGAPVILQSDNGSEFTSHVITELKEVWPTLKLVHGKPRHPQSQGSVERANGDIKDMLVAWMADNETQNWATGIKFVQFQKNSAHHSGIKCSPYSAMFGCEARVGLTSSALPTEVIYRMESEDDLLAAFSCSTPHTQEADIIQVISSSTTPSHETDSITALSNSPASSHETDSIPASSSSPTSPHETDSIPADLSSQTQPSVTTTPILEDHTIQIRKRRAEAYTALLSQAERMDLKTGVPGDNVAVPIPPVDRGRGDPRNILSVIVNRDVDTDQYKNAVKAGVLKGQYSRN
ncbi:KRAB-A domain-containing protein 2-like [Mya arenaria]|uniref:KRAB-A domain-containing protein 2-like n=1 Tax=Mya arenaria TaxID=6604 RepID=UPI0022E4B549|nr:KRAB-A domain-containing protein 2-like [Mya arenaria]